MNNQDIVVFNKIKKNKRPINLAAKQELVLNNKEELYLLASGRLDLFVYEKKIRQQYLFSLKGISALYGCDFNLTNNWGIVAVAKESTTCFKIKRAELNKLAPSEFISRLIEQWLKNLISIMDGEQTKSFTILTQTQTKLTANEFYSTEKQLLWFKLLQGDIALRNEPYSLLQHDFDFIPIQYPLGITSLSDANITTLTTAQWLAKKDNWSDLDSFHSYLLFYLAQTAQHEDAECQTTVSFAQDDLEIMQHSINALSGIFEKKQRSQKQIKNYKDLLIQTCEIVAEHIGFTIEKAKHTVLTASKEVMKNSTAFNNVFNIADQAGFMIRKVTLHENWWHADNGEMLGFYKETQQPVALITDHKKRYLLHDLKANKILTLNANLAEKLSPQAIIFYPSMPAKKIQLKDFFKMVSRQTKIDVVKILLFSFVIAVLNLSIPISYGVIFNDVIPSANIALRNQVFYVLITIIIAILFFNLAKAIAILRFSNRINSRLQPALWDRLVKLPLAFFSNYLAGDLADRVLGIDTLSKEISAQVITATIGFLFSFINIILLFYYAPLLAWIAVLLMLVTVGFLFLVNHLRLKYLRRSHQLDGELSGLILQFLNNIVKLRVGFSLARAYSIWAGKISAKKKNDIQSEKINAVFSVYETSLLLASNILFFSFVTMNLNQYSLGDFIAFITAYTLFISGVLALASVLTEVLDIFPVYERLKPILNALPEATKGKSQPGKLSGQISFDDVSYHYPGTETLVLKNITLQINPGEFIAFVGTSGSGKSTLFRLLLGFDHPSEGHIYYNNMDLIQLDLKAVRRQLGTVMPTGALMAASIYENIASGSISLSLEEAWQAAEHAGIADFIKSLPMGMNTLLLEGATTLSGGQRQQLMIARALARKPQLLLFDEATSALDNNSQALITKNIRALNLTRIVIAHRLSTIIDADRIYVIDDGKIIQAGTYEELMQQPGFFTTLAKRQLS